MMVRRARMQGHPTLWVPGVDHAGIAAQVVLDRILAKEGESRASLGRERYLERMWQYINSTRDTINDQHRRLGVSVDWSRLRFTMDEGSARAVRVAFKRLYDDGLAYRGEQLVNWCPGDQTSVSDLEVVSTPASGTLWSVRYHFVRDDGTPSDETLTVATTRPETILGDTAVAVHPDDPRYASAIGRRVLIPFVDRIVPVIADTVVRQEFGTGAVKITPAHDQDDFATAKRHDLPLIDVMTDDGRINERGAQFAGLTLEEARKRILEELETGGDLAGAAPHEMTIGRCERSNDVIEPRLKTQWFINVAPMADKAMTSVREGRTAFVPKRYFKTFFDWMENIHDWNVQRQLWWGHRIPAWYCPDGHITVSDAAEGPRDCSVCGRPGAELVQEEGIFDTWFSSGLWPFSTLGWPDDTSDLRRYYPTSVMETGWEILFFWVARMMMLGEWLTGKTPFHTVYLHGMVRDPYGAKMSKTKGNVLDPLEVARETGADALRFALVHGSEPSGEQKLSDTRIEGARNFANKLWNAARFVVGARPAEVAADALLEPPDPAHVGPAEHWILARSALAVAQVEKAYADYRFGDLTRLLYDAVWSEYCDWYVELAKVGLAADAPAERRAATWRTLTWVLDRYLRLLHPVVPHITEHIWSRLPHRPADPALLIVAPWPQAADSPAANESLATGVAELIELIGAIRAARAESGIEAADILPAQIWLADGPARAAYPDMAAAVARLARVTPTLIADRAALGSAAGLAVVTAGAEARLARSEADRQRERARLEKELHKLDAQLGAARARLADADFTRRAPAPVVDQARQRVADLEGQFAALTARSREV
jgi:valyl-tRNA synthetase